MSSYREAAENIVASLKRSYSRPHTVVPVQEADFGHLDLAVYADFRASLEKSGYRYIADYEIVDVTRDPGSLMQRTMIRTLLSSDGTTVGAYYQVRPRMERLILNLINGILALRLWDAPATFLKHRVVKHCYDFESELGNAYVTTSNARDAASFSRPATIDAEFFDYATPLAQVRVAHEKRLAAAVARGGSATVMSTSDQVLSMGARMKVHKDAHRAASNWITRNEIRDMAGGDAEVADAVYEEVQKLLAEQRVKAPSTSHAPPG